MDINKSFDSVLNKNQIEAIEIFIIENRIKEYIKKMYLKPATEIICHNREKLMAIGKVNIKNIIRK